MLLPVEEGPKVAFNASAYSVLENAGATTVTVTRSGDTSGEVSVHYATGPDVQSG